MNGLTKRCLPGLLGALLWASGCVAQTLQVVGVDGNAVTVTAAQLAKAARTTVSVTDHDQPAKYEGVTMATLLATAGMPLSDKMKSPQVTEAVLFEAADGYKVVYAMAEFDPAFSTREIILADTRDGRPLDAKEGPFRVIAPGDKRGARWIRQVTAIKVVAVK